MKLIVTVDQGEGNGIKVREFQNVADPQMVGPMFKINDIGGTKIVALIPIPRIVTVDFEDNDIITTLGSIN